MHINWPWFVAGIAVLVFGLVGMTFELSRTQTENKMLKKDNQDLELKLREEYRMVHKYQKAAHDANERTRFLHKAYQELAHRIECPPMPLIED